jgi:hypothetical protein
MVMSVTKKNGDLPPCPDPDLYILVKTREGSFWRRKRGTVTPARLNSAFAKNVSNTKLASPAARRIIRNLHPFLVDLHTGRLTARLTGLLVKTINQKGVFDFSLLKGFEFQQPALEKLLFTQVDVRPGKREITLSIPLYPGVVARRGNLVKDYYFEGILLYGDVSVDNDLQVESTISKLYSFEDESKHTCMLSLPLPEAGVPWMAILKAICQEEDRPSINPRHFGMRVMAVG